MENKALMALVNVAQKSALDMTEVMKLTDIYLPLFNIDWSIRKAMKSKLLECFQFNMENTRSNIAIIDMRLIWRAAMPSKSEREASGGTRLTWKWHAENMLNLILKRHPDAKEIHLINDSLYRSTKVAPEIYFQKVIKLFRQSTHLMFFLQIQETKYVSKSFFKSNFRE